MPQTALHHALTLADQGIASFPCRPNKQPTTPHGLYDASINPAALRALWRNHPGPLIGVACGEVSNLALLDIDAKHHAARIWWGQFQQQLRHTRAHRTRSGGIHIWFRHHSELPCTVSRIVKGVDTRGAGGYAIWWPATGLPVLSGAPIAHAPAWLLHLLKLREPPPPRAVIADSRRVRAVLQHVATAPEGTRNAQLYWAACRLAEMIGPDLSETEAANLLLQAASSAGLPYREALATARSGLRGPRS